jgi:hypothetical protein
VLGSHQPDRRQIEDLPGLLTDHRRLGQVGSAAPTRLGHVHLDPIRVDTRLQP